MPPLCAEYLVGFLFEIGPTLMTGMGESPLTHTEIANWQSNTGIELSAWESRVLKRLSLEYLGQSQLSTKPDCVSPWLDAPYFKAQPAQIAARLQDSIRKLAQL